MLTISDPAAAFASCLGWARQCRKLPEVRTGCRRPLAWAEQNQLSRQGPTCWPGCLAAGTTGWSLCSRRTWQRYGPWCRPMRRRC